MAKKAEIHEYIKKYLVEAYYLEKDDELLGKSKLMKDIGVDSLDIVEMIIDLEAKYEIDISDDELESHGSGITVENIVDIVKGALIDKSLGKTIYE